MLMRYILRCHVALLLCSRDAFSLSDAAYQMLAAPRCFAPVTLRDAGLMAPPLFFISSAIYLPCIASSFFACFTLHALFLIAIER